MFITVIAAALLSLPAYAESAGMAACDPNWLSPVDYAIGSWRAQSHDPHRGTIEHGRAAVTVTAGGCALEIKLDLESGYQEVRLISLDDRRGAWQLTVIDSNHGNLVVMNGYAVEGGLDFISTHPRRDRLLFDRVSIRPSMAGWIMRTETSAGYGAEWQLVTELSFFRDIAPQESSALDRSHPGWDLQSNYGTNLVRGDFDGNGDVDLGAHINYPDSTKQLIQAIVVVFNHSDSSTVRVMESADELYSLGVLANGTTECEVHTDKCWTLETDVLSVGYEEKAGWVYLWENGSFEMVVTGD